MKTTNVLRLVFGVGLGGWLLVLAAEEPLIWSSMGGGYRSYSFLMGYANLFAKAGLINATSSKFTSFQGASSAVWFSSQLFYSPQYFDRTINSSPEELRDFVIQWMESYKEIWRLVRDRLKRRSDSMMVDIRKEQEMSFVILFENMLEKASTDYGDPTFKKRLASPSNRVPAFRHTDYLVSLAVIPTARVRNGLGWLRDSLTYVRPQDSDDAFIVPINYQYAVKDDGAFFWKGVEDSSLPLRTCVTGKVPKRFSFRNWKQFYFFADHKGGNGVNFLPFHKVPPCVREGTVNEPFGGRIPSAIETAIITSAGEAEYSPLAPSSFAQALSTELYAIQTSDANIPVRWAQRLNLEAKADVFYRLADRRISIGACSQGPNNCGVHDLLFTHLGIADNNAVGMSIGQYQTIDGGFSTTTTIKQIVCTQANDDYANRDFLSYFSTTWNQGVAPGDYVWPTWLKAGPAVGPRMNPQIFDAYLDQEGFDNILAPVTGTNVSTAILDLTTMDNPSVRVKGGQPVKMLVLDIKGTGLPSNVFGWEVDGLKEALGDAALDIASSDELLHIVKDFADS